MRIKALLATLGLQDPIFKLQVASSGKSEVREVITVESKRGGGGGGGTRGRGERERRNTEI